MRNATSLVQSDSTDGDPAARSMTAHFMAAIACCGLSVSACLDSRVVVGR